MSYIVLMWIGASFIAPTGPGSGRIVFIFMLVYSCLLLILSSRTARVFGLVVGIIALVGIIQTTKDKEKFKRAMQERVEKLRPPMEKPNADRKSNEAKG